MAHFWLSTDDIMSALPTPPRAMTISFHTGTRLYWCDAQLDKIESSDIYGNDRKFILGSQHAALHPFDLIWHYESLIWTDWYYGGLGLNEGFDYAWPKNYVVSNIFLRPAGIHVYDGKKKKIKYIYIYIYSRSSSTYPLRVIRWAGHTHVLQG